MSVNATRTLNPLHFEDLEPRRFEDLVRQLAYDFRKWRVIEATGRLGKDEGVDIRAIEVVDIDEDDKPDGEAEVRPEEFERTWSFQCKREKEIGPTKLSEIVSESIHERGEAPYGFVLAAACDFSKASRDRFRAELTQKGVQEFYLWGKADLEDMLFLPKNDHLLFAYFNISIQVRRRSRRSQIRGRLATKKSLYRVFGKNGDPFNLFEPVLIRDVAVEMPSSPFEIKSLVEARRWVYANCVGHIIPDHLGFIVRRHRAFIADDRKSWDAMLGVKDTQAARILLGHHAKEYLGSVLDRHDPYDYQAQVPDKNKGWHNVFMFIHYDRIMALDEDGDVWSQGPQLIVDFDPIYDAFERTCWRTLSFSSTRDTICSPKPQYRIAFFPPDLRGAAVSPKSEVEE